MAQDGLPTAVLQPRPREHLPGNAPAVGCRRYRRPRQRGGAPDAFLSAAAVAGYGLTVEGGPIRFYTGK